MPMIAVSRIALGLFCFVHYVLLLPYAAEVWSTAGMLPDAALNVGFPWALSPLYWLDSPLALRLVVGGLVAASAAYAAGWRTRTMGVLIGLGTYALWHRNLFTTNPSYAYLGFWFLLQLFTPANPPVSVDRWLARRAGLRGPLASRLPPDVLRVLWVVHAVAYSFSGWTKAVSPSWRGGHAFRILLDGPLGLTHPLADLVRALPDAVLSVATWGALGLELLYAPLALYRPARPWLWVAMLGMHLGLWALVGLADISAAMVCVHLFLFDPRWVGRAPTRAPELVPSTPDYGQTSAPIQPSSRSRRAG
jgi:hypothetical protein